MPLNDSNGHILSDSVLSPIDMPPFRQSAMDGYALCLTKGDQYHVIDEVKAGDGTNSLLRPGEAVRIYTGAPVPDTADAIAVQEKVIAQEKTITLTVPVTSGANVRPLGEQVKAGGVALQKGTKLSPAAIGYLASLGITEVAVFEKPSIAIIATGNELIDATQPLTRGKIYESNATMLASALQSVGYKNVAIWKLRDNYEDTKELLNTAISEKDMVILTGGISVGDYDFVGKALNELNIEPVFYKIRQKPGKPLFFGKKDSTSVFALPGNPAAALSCFYVYVWPYLEKQSGYEGFSLPRIKTTSLSNFQKKGDRSAFLKALLTHEGVTILDGQSSAMLNTFSKANALVYLTDKQQEIKYGEAVNVICLPN